METISFFWWLLIVFTIIFIFASLVKISPNEKWVKERLSKYVWILGQGWHVIIPIIDSVKKADMRERVLNTPPQEMITKDNAVVTVDAVIYTQIMDAAKAVYEIQDPFLAVTNLSITSLRSIIWTMSLDEVLWERTKINTKVQTELAEETEKWWVQINKIEISRLDPPQDIQQAMSKQMKAEREKRALMLEAEWKKEAAIREAEWIKQKQILEADGQWQAIERIATAKAKALELESNAAINFFKWNAITKEQLRVIEESLKANSKYILDSDILNSVKNIFWKNK